MTFSYLSLLVLLVSILQPVAAWFRLPCITPVAEGRTDWISDRGKSPSQHVHTAQGGINFFPNTTYDVLRQSSCTSCVAKEDLSNYWYPKLYFRDPKTGKVEAVPDGGLTVYYLFRGVDDKKNGGSGLKAFPNGLKMLTGTPTRRNREYQRGNRSTQAALDEEAVEWLCRGTDIRSSNTVGGFPSVKCPQGLRADLHFQSCWDGMNLDSPDHKSHVAYLSDLDNGKCPETHPIPMPHLFYETFWATDKFNDRWEEANGWPFVWSTGDSTGYGFHGDFGSGWDHELLQHVIDECDSTPDQLNGVIDACPLLTIQEIPEAQKCKTPIVVSEDISGPLDNLPGENPIWPLTPQVDGNQP